MKVLLIVGILALLFVFGYIVYARWACSGPLFGYTYWSGTNMHTGKDTGGRYCQFIGFKSGFEKMFRTDSDIGERLQDSVGQIVSYSGIARDAQAGAVLSIEGVVVATIYIENLSAWPEEYLDKKVTVTGTLAYKTYMPSFFTVRSGVASQGAEGMQYVFENPVWKMK